MSNVYQLFPKTANASLSVTENIRAGLIDGGCDEEEVQYVFDQLAPFIQRLNSMERVSIEAPLNLAEHEAFQPFMFELMGQVDSLVGAQSQMNYELLSALIGELLKRKRAEG